MWRLLSGKLVVMLKYRTNLKSIDLELVYFFQRSFIPFARFSLFLIFFWFGLIKILGLSPASPLAKALVDNTVGIVYFDSLFLTLALLECFIGLLFLLPNFNRIVIPLLLVHMVIVCSPLLFVSQYTWQAFAVPTLEGQYIIKNAVVVAVAIGIASSTTPLSSRK